ncbi:MAG: homoserine kinase [Planctomycetota bacterium]|nr:homoserine kinase [Planctomycetota bacterium]
MSRWRIHAPASSANLGPGFDVLGIAVNLGITVELQLNSGGGFAIESHGPGSDTLPRDRTHLIARVAEEIAGDALDHAAMKIVSTIPMARGLGSSAAAHACGVAAGLVLRDNCAPDPAEVFQRLSVLEGHPDNAAACITGGFQAGGFGEKGWTRSPLFIESEPRLLALIPAIPLPTQQAREALPDRYSRSAIISNLGAMATLISGLARGDWDAVDTGTNDQIHQPFRLPLIPGLSAALAALRQADGVRGGWLSGAGPTLAGFLPDPQTGTEVASVAVDALEAAGTACQICILEVDRSGLQVENLA